MSEYENDKNPNNKYKNLRDEEEANELANELDIANIPLSRKNFILVFSSLVICLAMSSLDSSIVSTALPTISAQFKSESDYTWILTAYYLGDMAFEPMFGKFADIFGRKQLLLFVLTLFIVSSALCGAAQNMKSLIVFRGFQGIGGGGFFSMVILIIADIVPLRKRGVYMGITSAVSTCASITGPLIGGLFTDYLSWRWAFLINFPLCVIAGVIIFFYLNIPPKETKTTFKQKLKKIDFLGTFLLVVFTVSFLLSLSWGGSRYEWDSIEIVSLLSMLFVSFPLFIIVEYKVAKNPIIPLQMFRNHNVITTCLINFFFGMSAMTVNNTLPLLFHDGLGISATFSGLLLAPQSITSSLGNILTGYLIGKFGYIQRYMMAGTLIIILGNYLLTTIGMSTPIVFIIFIVILLGLKLGLNTHSCVLITQQCVQRKYMSIGSTVMTFFHLIGGNLGITLYGVVVANKFKNLYFENNPNVNNANIKDIPLLPNGTKYYVESIQFTYKVIPLVASVLTLIFISFLKDIPLLGSRTKKSKDQRKSYRLSKNSSIIITKTTTVDDSGPSPSDGPDYRVSINVPNNGMNTDNYNDLPPYLQAYHNDMKNIINNTVKSERQSTYRYSRFSQRQSMYRNRKSHRISYILPEMNVLDYDDEDDDDNNNDDDVMLDEEDEEVEVTLF